MTDLLVSLAIGIVLIAGANVLLERVTRLGARGSAIIVALATLAIYVPMAILHWPGGDLFAIHIALYLVVSVAFGLIGSPLQPVGAAGQVSTGRSRGSWGPWVIVAFFAALAATDAVFVTVADRGISTMVAHYLLPPPADDRVTEVNSAFPGVTSHDFQKKEALYNQYLEQVKLQRERGWQVKKGWLGEAVAGQPARLQVTVNTRDGQPLRGATVHGRFLRPADSRLDHAFDMQEVDSGIYRAVLTMPAPGSWSLVLEIRKGDDLHEVRANTSVRAAD